MKMIINNKYEFIEYEDGNAKFLFSTARGGLNFNKSIEEGIINLNNIKKWFNVEEVGYLNQIHSNEVFIYDNNVKSGDALITDKKNTAIGVFTADCVPILLYDKKNDVISAVHSGWKGTLSCISVKALNLMKKEFGSQSENIIAYIGPHIGGCCYEVGKEVQDKFMECKLYDNIEIINNNKLDLEKCILLQLTNEGVKKENITSLNLCNFCDDKYELHSYRKGNINYGRMFSFVYLK